MDLATVGELLRERIGLDPASSGPGLIARAVRARLRHLRLDEARFPQYLALLRSSLPELQALVEEVVVAESWFFRDEHPFLHLANAIIPRWLAQPALPPLRALSLPCAGGEEPYSLAMTLLDRGLTPDRFRVDAVDVSATNIANARRGLYTQNAFRGRDLAFRDRHFLKTPSGYELAPRLKTAVHFLQGNLIDDHLLRDELPYDVLFCRNLLIYLDAPSRRLAFRNLDHLLAPTGTLFLGHAEQNIDPSLHYQPTGDRRAFAFDRIQNPAKTTKTIPSHPKTHPATKRTQSPNPPPLPPTKRTQASPPQPSIPAPTKRTQSPVPTPQPDPTPPSPLDEASRLADQGRHTEAAALCERALSRAGPSAPAYFLLGMIRQSAGHRDLAERTLEKAVYLDPHHEEALVALAHLAQRRGDAAAAANYRRRAERAARAERTQ